MEGVLVLLGLVVLAIPVAVIYLLVATSGLRRNLTGADAKIAKLEVQLSDFERQIARLRSGTATPDAQAEQDTTPPPAAISETLPQVSAPATAPEPTSAQAPTTPIAASTAKRAAPLPPPRPPQQVKPSILSTFLTWMIENWFYVVSAISLALAGVFLVDYGMQNGLLPPPARVAAALAFGLALIGAGEWIRRRWGDETDGATAYLPSVFSGAGIVTLFGGLLAARVLYDLIGAETALVGMVLVAVLALVLGWFHGPLLAAVGVLGAFGAPFVVGGSSDDPSWLYGYFAIIAALGLGIDTLRRWAWVSVLTLVAAFGAGPLITIGEPNVVWAFILYLTALAVMAVLIPARSLRPDQSGPMIAEVLSARQKSWPHFPVLLAGGALLVSVGWLVVASGAGRSEFWMSVLALAALAGGFTIWSKTGRALQDLTVVPVVGFVVSVLIQGSERGGVWRDFARAYEGNPEASYPVAVTALIALAVGVSALAVWRSVQGGRYGVGWAAAAAGFAPISAVMVELTWAPSQSIGAYGWALHGAALAIAATLLAGLYARIDGPDARLRASLAALAAVATMSFALVIVLDDDALTLALVATLVFAAWLDRRFDLPALTVFVSLCVVAIGYRLITGAEPSNVIDQPWLSLIAVYAGSVAGFAAALWLLVPRPRLPAKVMLETGLWSALGLTVSLCLLKVLNAIAPKDEAAHWVLGLYAVIWLTLMCVQLRRSDLGGWMRMVRLGLAGVFGLIGFGALILAATLMNPLLDDWAGRVLGPPVLNTLALAYLAPALVLGAAALRLQGLIRPLRLGFLGVAGALTALWGFGVIRHFWQGARGFELRNGMDQPELYTYTVVLLLIGAGLFYQSLAKGNATLRKAGLVVIGLSVAKVFFVDISGLQGLTRVFSLLLLGLSLAGLAWLNRWAQGRTQSAKAATASPPDED